MRYISRLGNGWTVRVPVPETGGTAYLYSRFLDRDYGSQSQALDVAKKQRDVDARLIGADKPRVKRKRKNATPDLITGLSQVNTSRTGEQGQLYEINFIIAYHPLTQTIKKKFAYRKEPTRANSRNREQALKLAEEQRRKWEKESGLL